MRVFLGIAATLLQLWIVSAAAYAQTTSVGDFYFGLDAGLMFPENITTRAALSITTINGTTLNTTTVPLDQKFRFRPGQDVALISGYHFNDRIAIEVNFQCLNVDFSAPTVSITDPSSPGFGFGILGSNGHLDLYTGIVNGIFTPIGRSDWNGLSPYIGGGVGLAYSDDKATFVGGSSASHANVNLAADAILGLDYNVTSQFALGARYQFLWTHVSSQSVLAGGESNNDFTDHGLTAHATIQF